MKQTVWEGLSSFYSSALVTCMIYTKENSEQRNRCHRKALGLAEANAFLS